MPSSSARRSSTSSVGGRAGGRAGSNTTMASLTPLWGVSPALVSGYAASGPLLGASPRRRLSSSRSSPGSSASRRRSIAATTSVSGWLSRSNRRAGRMRSCGRAAAGGAGGLRGSDSAVGGGGGRLACQRLGVRRVAAQQPRAVGPADQLPAVRQLRQGGGHRRPAGAHELAEDAVRQRQRHDHAVARDAAPALGQVPEEGLQAPVHARELGDGLGGGEP